MRHPLSLVIVILFFLFVDFSIAETFRTPLASNVTQKRRKFYGKNHDTCSPRSVSPFQLYRPFALSISFILPFDFVPFADRQHPDAYPNSLTIPIEPLPIRTPMATSRKESRDMGKSPLPPLLSFEPSYIFSRGSFFSLFYCKTLILVQFIPEPIAP